MSGNYKAPSIVGCSATITVTPKVGSLFGPLNPGVRVRIDEEVNVDEHPQGAALRAEYEANVGNPHPGQFYIVTITANPEGESLEGLPAFMVGGVVLFRDEFDLID